MGFTEYGYWEPEVKFWADREWLRSGKPKVAVLLCRCLPRECDSIPDRLAGKPRCVRNRCPCAVGCGGWAYCPFQSLVFRSLDDAEASGNSDLRQDGKEPGR